MNLPFFLKCDEKFIFLTYVPQFIPVSIPDLFFKIVTLGELFPMMHKAPFECVAWTASINETLPSGRSWCSEVQLRAVHVPIW